MEIDDILASVTTDPLTGRLPTTTGPSTGGLLSPETTDLAQLSRAWVNERCAPELLPWPAELMDRVLGRVRAQIELVERQTGDMDPKINFRLIVVQTELERVKYLVRSFVRTRLAKIDRHATYYLSLSSSSTTTLLSSTEHAYATSHQSLLGAHFAASFLSAFPPQLQRLDDTAGGISMVEPPDADGAVLVRALADTRQPVSVPGDGVA